LNHLFIQQIRVYKEHSNIAPAWLLQSITGTTVDNEMIGKMFRWNVWTRCKIYEINF